MNPTLPLTALPPPLLDIVRATLIRDNARILDNVSLRIDEGQHTAIVGPNGSGKSSLIKLITRRYYPVARDTEPIVSIFGRSRWDIFALRTLLGIVSGDLDQEYKSSSDTVARHAVLSGFFASRDIPMNKGVTPEMESRADTALQHVDILHLAARNLETLSTGEMRRVLIARALVNDPRALLLDEPTAGLDLIARRRFLETIRSIAQQGKTILLITHHIEEVLPEINRVILMRDGKIFRDGAKRDTLTSETMSALFDAPVMVREQRGYYSAEAG